MPTLFLLRGLPGSGKSSLAKELSEEGKYPVFSIDDYFTDSRTGAYEFKFEENHLAYSACIKNAREAIQAGASKVFIANTFTMEWELEPYFSLSAELRCKLFVLTVENRHGGKNIHEVSLEQLEKMAEKYRVILFANE